MKRIVTHMSLMAATAMIATGCVPVRHNLPPEQRMLEPGPGVGGPGPGVLGAPPYGGMGGGPMMGAGGMMGGPMGGPMMGGPGGPMPPGAIGQAGPDVMRSVPLQGGPMMGTSAMNASMKGAAGEVGLVNYACGTSGCNCGGGPGGCLGGGQIGEGAMIPAGGGYAMNSMAAAIPSTVQVTLGQPDGMHVRYDATGSGMFDSEPLVVPARQNFPQGGLYRLKLTNIPAREGVELYPTVELAYSNPRTGAYLAHNSVPLQFTEEDFDQVLTGNFVTKVIYLPDPDFQGPALAGIDTLVSTRLDPGIDPIVEADRRGSILAIIRLGDKDIEMSGAGGISGGIGGGAMFAPPIAGLPAPFAPAMTDGCGCAGGSSTPVGLPGMVAGYNAPQYGMPITGTPIGLPGPPHIPLGHPAGLKKHVIKNHTPMNIPRPVEKVKMNVRMQPGYSYPNPVSRVRITEQNINPGVPNGRGLYQHQSQAVDSNSNY
ncbi:hypothetical protein K227x_13980 [Rubripirellula lacrimiformis]|uniref:Uncharacterized protein n=1 Tax=Rubripirellula lacrimiformis TaxID=1930273 RepID=A0A517N790_9BACT|nr:hypothetical protein [Rubripirellula lacrimiformis]QDT03019.1 hypothetical protein K227x_13980 [Rubripirellula lacrimiformis]